MGSARENGLDREKGVYQRFDLTRVSGSEWGLHKIFPVALGIAKTGNGLFNFSAEAYETGKSFGVS